MYLCFLSLNFNGAAKLLEHCFQTYVSFELCHFNSLQELDAMKKEKQYLQEITKYISVKQCKQKESTLRTIHRGPDHLWYIQRPIH